MSSTGARQQPRTGGGAFRAFRSRDFAFFWVASLLSIMSFFMLFISRGWLVLELTDSPFVVTAVAGAAELPTLFLSIPGGVLADRVSRKAVLVAGEATNAFALVTLAFLVTSGQATVTAVLVLSVVSGVAFAVAFPARAAVVPNLVPRGDIANGVALASVMFSGATLVGPGLAGWMMAELGVGASFWAPAAASVGALVLFLPVRADQSHREREARAAGTGGVASVLRDAWESLVYIRRDAAILGLIVIGLVAVVFGSPYQTILPVFARDVLDAGTLGLGILGATGGIGAIAASFLVAWRNGPVAMRAYIVWGSLGFGVSIAAFALSPVFALSVVLALVAGFAMQVLLTASTAVVQVLVPDELRGRVMSVRMIMWGVAPLGIFALGGLAEVTGAPLATAAFGLLTLAACALTMAALPAVRAVHYPRPEGAPRPAPVHLDSRP
jgi:MFS family permease